MKAKNQLVLLSGIFVLLATATIAASNIVQPANAAFGNDVIKPYSQGLQGGGTPPGQNTAGEAQDTSKDSYHNGLADIRANGDKFDYFSSEGNYVGPGNNGKGGPDFSPDTR